MGPYKVEFGTKNHRVSKSYISPSGAKDFVARELWTLAKKLKNFSSADYDRLVDFAHDFKGFDILEEPREWSVLADSVHDVTIYVKMWKERG
jgi:hypothetical protein